MVEIYVSMIESPLAFFQMKIEGSARDSVELEQPSFGEAPEGFDAIDVAFSVGKLVFIVANTKVFLVSEVDQAVVTGPRVAVDNAVQADFATNDVLECLLPGVGDDLCVDVYSTFVYAKNDGFAPCSTSSFAGDSSWSEVGLVNLNDAIKLSNQLAVFGQTTADSKKDRIDTPTGKPGDGGRFCGREIEGKTACETAKFVLRNL